MKKIFFIVFLFLVKNTYSQVSEIYSFSATNKPQDYSSVGIDNLFNGKYFYVANGSNKKTFLYYIQDENQPILLKEVTSTSAAANTSLQGATAFGFRVSENLLYFTTVTFVSGFNLEHELWRTDGTESGTIKLLSYTGTSTNGIRLNFIEKNSSVVQENSLNGGILFFCSATPNTRSLWKTDGTITGTVELHNYTGSDGNALNQNRVLAEVNNHFIYAYYNTTTFLTELWKTDGTSFSRLTDGNGVPQNLRFFLGKLDAKIYYVSTNNQSVYSTDGIVATKEFDTPESISNSFFNKDDFYYLSQTIGTENFKLYYVSGDISNRTLIASFSGGIHTIEYANEKGVIIKKSENFNTVFSQIFVSKAGVVTQNTNPLKVTEFCNYRGDTYVGAELYTDPSLIGKEIWKYEAPTSTLLQNLNPGSFAGFASSSTPKYFFEQNGNLYFIADVGSTRKLFSIKKDFTFKGSIDNSWNNANNWDSNAIPNLTNNITIPSGFNVAINADSYAKNMTTSSPINIISGNLHINGMATLNANITLNNNDLILTGTASNLVGNNTSYIITNATGSLTIESLNTVRGTLNLPVGTTSNYNPISISNSGTSDTFSVNVQDGISNTTGGAVSVTWNISEETSGGSNVDLSLTWNQTQENAFFTRNTSKIGHYYNSVWNAENSGIVSGTNPYSITATGITSFSPFSVLNETALTTNEIKFKNNIIIYPNPSKGDYIILGSSETLGAKVSVYNLLGQKIKSFELETITTNQNLENGIYILEISKENKKESKRLIINKS